MKKNLFLLLLIINTITIMAQNKLFEKKINNNVLQILEEKEAYRTVLTNTKNKKIVLEEFGKNASPFGNIGSRQQGWFNIINADIKDAQLFVLYYNFGLIELKIYHLMEGKKNTITNYFIDRQTLISWDNGGDVNYSSQMKWIDSDLYMDISAGQQYGKKTEGLYKYINLNHKIIHIKFPETPIVIKDPKKVLYALDLIQNKEKVSEEIKNVLLTSNVLKNDQFSYLGDLDVSNYYENEKYKFRTSGYNYFFYKQNQATKIIRYNNYNKEWLIGDYKEEEIKQK